MKTRLTRIKLSERPHLKATPETDGLRDEAKNAGNPRSEWDEAFAMMVLQGDDALLDGEELLPTRWDEKEWEWR
jgi:hypothetical protein